MPSRFDSSLYQQDIEYCANLPLQWDKLADKTIAISGATGMIGTFLIDVLMKKNEDPSLIARLLRLDAIRVAHGVDSHILMRLISILSSWMCRYQVFVPIVRLMLSFILPAQHIPEHMPPNQCQRLPQM